MIHSVLTQKSKCHAEKNGKTNDPDQSLKKQRETVLLVDDNADVRFYLKGVLEDYYYNVIEAGDGLEAVKKFAERTGEIDLVVLDVIMPKKDGRAAYEEIKKLKPDVKVLFTSGHIQSALLCNLDESKCLSFVQKPFTSVEFLAKIAELLYK